MCHKEIIKKMLNKEQEFVVKYVPPSEEELRAAREATKKEHETDGTDYGVIYGLLTNWNPFA